MTYCSRAWACATASAASARDARRDSMRCADQCTATTANSSTDDAAGLPAASRLNGTEAFPAA